VLLALGRGTFQANKIQRYFALGKKRIFNGIKNNIGKIIFRIRKGRPLSGRLRLTYFVGSHYSIDDFGGYETRHVSTIRLLTMALTIAKENIKNNFSVVINTSDYAKDNTPHFAYAKSEDQTNVILIPDFVMDSWPACGIDDYPATVNAMVEQSKENIAHEKLFWIGNITTHKSRGTLCELAQIDNRIETIAMDWQRNEFKVLKKQPSTIFISLPEHCRYKYLIDIQGEGYSGRVKILLFSGRPLFLVDRQWHEYFYKDIKPYTHYIPVKEDLSDLIEKLDWADHHREEVLGIAKNAQDYAINNLTREKAVEYLANILVEYSKNHPLF
jgi:hypothetical protein